MAPMTRSQDMKDPSGTSTTGTDEVIGRKQKVAIRGTQARPVAQKSLESQTCDSQSASQDDHIRDVDTTQNSDYNNSILSAISSIPGGFMPAKPTESRDSGDRTQSPERRRLRALSLDTFNTPRRVIHPEEAIAMAENSLSPAERELLNRRERQLAAKRARDESDADISDTGTARVLFKGKGIDPRNWGTFEDDPDMDVAAQRAALNSLRKAPKGVNSSKLKGASTEQARGREPCQSSNEASDAQMYLEQIKQLIAINEQLLAEKQANQGAEFRSAMRRAPENSHVSSISMVNRTTGISHRPRNVVTFVENDHLKPHQQIDPDSFLGRELNRLLEDPDPSESSSSSEDSDDADDQANRRGHRHSKSKRKHGARRVRIDPIKPDQYDGSENPSLYTKFLTQGTDYVIFGRVRSDMQVSILGNFLTGKALKFYQRYVSTNRREWTLYKIFTELFDYCFPFNFREIILQKIVMAKQGDRSVREFAEHLVELYMFVGDSSGINKCYKFFDGLNSELQSRLFEHGYSFESRDFDSLVEKAESLQRALSYRFRKSPSHPTTGGSDRGYGRLNYSPGGSSGTSGLSGKDGNIQPQQSGQDGLSINNGPALVDDKKSGAVAFSQYPKLGDSKKHELAKKGLCFVCEKPGHMSRNCPDSNRVRGSGSPGTPSLNVIGNASIEVDYDAIERQRVESKFSELSLYSVGFNCNFPGTLLDNIPMYSKLPILGTQQGFVDSGITYMNYDPDQCLITGSSQSIFPCDKLHVLSNNQLPAFDHFCVTNTVRLAQHQSCPGDCPFSQPCLFSTSSLSAFTIHYQCLNTRDPYTRAAANVLQESTTLSASPPWSPAHASSQSHHGPFAVVRSSKANAHGQAKTKINIRENKGKKKRTKSAKGSSNGSPTNTKVTAAKKDQPQAEMEMDYDGDVVKEEGNGEDEGREAAYEDQSDSAADVEADEDTHDEDKE